jgi:antitoxin (DNA-binding transcriptional repressor) of toxin-antitoxin stability system
MAAYSIYEAKAKFSEVIRRVKRGESVTITERGKPTAVISLIEPEVEDPNEAHIRRLIAEGAITPAKKKFSAKKFKGHNIPGAYERFMADRHRES